jgi:hypothetical protein
MDASKGFYTPAFAAPVFPATDPHVLTRQTTSSHTPRVLVKGRRGPSRSSNSVQPDSKVPSTEPPTLSNPVNPVSTHQPSSDAVAGLPHAAPAPSRFRRKEHPRSWTQQMVKDPLVERFEKLRLPVAPATLPIPSSRSPTNFSFPLSSHDSTTAAKQAWNRMAVSHPILPVFQEQSQSRSNRRDALPQAYRSRPGQQSTGPIAIDEDSDEDLTVVSARPVTNFSNTNFFQSGDREPSNQRRRLQIDRFLRKNPARRSRSPSASSSGSDDELTPGSSEDSHLDLAARVAQAERRGQPYGYHEKLQEEQDHLLAERMQHDEGTAPSLFSQRLCSSATKSASQWQTQRTPHRKTTPISSLKRAIARAGTRDDPINLDSDSDNIGEARGKPMELDETSQLQSTGGRDCAVCGDSVKVSNLPSLPDCAHRPETCPDCYSDWISAQLQDSNWGNVKCPGDGCNTALSYYDIRAYASPEVFQRYDTFIARAAFSQDRKSAHSHIHPGPIIANFLQPTFDGVVPAILARSISVVWRATSSRV